MKSSKKDRLNNMFDRRLAFMKMLREHVPEEYTDGWPLDLTTKSGQMIVRDVALRGVEEIFEAVSLLKNAKPHRVTNVPDFDKEHFLEEMVDAFNYFFSLIILAGLDEDDLYKMYCTKDDKIRERIKTGY